MEDKCILTKLQSHRLVLEGKISWNLFCELNNYNPNLMYIYNVIGYDEYQSELKKSGKPPLQIFRVIQSQ